MIEERTKYEYRTLLGDGLPSMEQLNELGQDGWVLVNIIYIPGGGYAIFLGRRLINDDSQNGD